jgi:hypothetical protein
MHHARAHARPLVSGRYDLELEGEYKISLPHVRTWQFTFPEVRGPASEGCRSTMRHARARYEILASSLGM